MASRMYDAIVAGLGAMGSAAAFHLARGGASVLGLDRFRPPHDRGSSHGRSRIIREAYFEHPAYVPLVRRAYELWEELEKLSKKRLLARTGGLMIGAPHSGVVQGALRSADQHGLKCELLTAFEVRARFPGIRPDDEMVAVHEPRAGYLNPEACVEAHLEQARRAGAELRFDEPVTGWTADRVGVIVRTARGDVRARRLVVSAGAWLGSLLGGELIPYRIERQVLYWFEGRGDWSPERCPIHLWEYERNRHFYGFPDAGDGVKVAFHHEGEAADPAAVRREVSPREVESMRAVVRRFLPEADGPLRSTAVCLYTNMPDQHFWIDAHARHPAVLIVSPCSGHGFKFSAAIGEQAAAMVLRGKPTLDLSLFRRRRAPA